MKFPPIVYVRWNDACVPGDGSIETDIADCEPMELHAAGWLISYSDIAIKLCLEFHDGSLTARSWMVIPRACIVDMQVLSRPKKTSARKKKKKKHQGR